MKDVLFFLLPLLIFPLFACSLVKLKKKAFKVIIALLGGALISMFIAGFYSYGVAHLTFPWISLSMPDTTQESNLDQLTLIFKTSLKPFFSVELSLLGGFVVGGWIAYFPNLKTRKIIEAYAGLSHFILQKIFLPLLPVYVFGFMVDMAHNKSHQYMLYSSYKLFIILTLATLVYIYFYYLMGAGWRLKKALKHVKNAFPSVLAGFSSMSSLLAMPVTIKDAKKNLQDGSLADLVVPTTVNCHVLGDVIGLSILSLGIYFLHFHTLPILSDAVIFVAMVALAQFGAVSIPGGSLVILGPVLVKYLCFSEEMVGLATAVAVFLDPWCTSCNVLGNGGYVTVVERVIEKK